MSKDEHAVSDRAEPPVSEDADNASGAASTNEAESTQDDADQQSS